ncbi:hypothetical protein [Amycolatopsis panacis]|nr:hypothetical protein [Amycolatopsis panacis]
MQETRQKERGGMGFIPKTLMLSTGGLVRGSSKKQRVAKRSSMS